MEKWFIVLILAAFAPSAPAQAAGPTNSIQYNAGGGTFGGSSALTFVPGTLTLAPTLYSSSIEGYNFADQNSGGLTSAGIFSTAVCTTLGCFVVAPPTWSSGTYFSSYAVDGNSPFYNFVGTSRSILKDDRGMASAVLFRDPVQPTAASAHFAYTHACLFSTPYETAGAQYNGGGSCFQLSMAGANSGYSHGNPLFLTTPVPVLPGTGWSHGNAIGVHYTNFTPGVHQGMSMSYYNQAVGDTAGAYYYVQTNGGVTAASDEGFKALAGDSGENPSQYYGTVNSPGGTGLTQISTLPAVGPGGTASSDASQGDGSYLIDTAGAPYPPTLSPYNMTGLVQLGGQTPDEMTVGGTGTVTASTAIGTLAAALAPNYCVPVGNCTQLMTFTVSLMSGAFQMTYPSTNIICFADGFHEQAVVTMRSVPIGGVQSVTAVIREPHPAGTWVFQGGSSCQFGSFDANINTGPGGQGTRNTLRYLFEVFGAPDTTHLYVGSFSYGGLASLPLGNVSRATGNTTFNIFPGAEVLDVQDYSMADAITAPQVDGTFTLEPNNVVWSAVSPPDTVEEPHNPVGAYCGICWSLIINSPQAVKSVGYKFSVGGQGAQGGHYDNAAGFDAVKVPNTTLNTFYVGNGGLAAPPGGIRLTGGGTGPSGLFAYGLAMDEAPQNGNPVFWVGAPSTTVMDPSYTYDMVLAAGNVNDLQWQYTPYNDTMSLGPNTGVADLYIGTYFSSAYSACSNQTMGYRFAFGGYFCHGVTTQTTYMQNLSAGTVSTGTINLDTAGGYVNIGNSASPASTGLIINAFSAQYGPANMMPTATAPSGGAYGSNTENFNASISLMTGGPCLAGYSEGAFASTSRLNLSFQAASPTGCTGRTLLEFVDFSKIPDGVMMTHLVSWGGVSPAPPPLTLTVGVGAGMGTPMPTVSYSGATDLRGNITLTTGPSPSPSSVIMTITFNEPYQSPPSCVISPANAAAIGMAYAPFTSASSFTINSGSTALSYPGTYAWSYVCAD